MKINNLAYLTVLIVFSFFVGLIGAVKLSIILFGLTAFFAYLINPIHSIFLYLVFLPLNTIYEKQFGLYGLITPDLFIYLFTILSLFNIKIKTLKTNSDLEIIIISKYLLIVVFLYLTIWDIKYTILGIEGMNVSTFIQRFLYFIFKFLPLYIIMRMILAKRFRIIFEYAMYHSIIILFLFELLSNSSLLVHFKLDNPISIGDVAVSRSGGLYGFGDTNSLGIFYTICIGYFFHKFEKIKKFRKTELIIIIVSLFGILISLSRTSIIVALFIVIIFLLRNIKYKRGINVLFIFFLISFLIYFTFQNYIEVSLIRFSSINADIGLQGGTRPYKWLFFLSEIFRNPHNLVFGPKYIIMVSSVFRAPHNFYITLLYNTGIFLLIPFIYLQIKIIHKYYNIKLTSGLYILIPYIANCMTISDLGVHNYIFILIPIFYYSHLNKINLKNFV